MLRTGGGSGLRWRREKEKMVVVVVVVLLRVWAPGLLLEFTKSTWDSGRH